MVRKSSGNLHFFINGLDQGVAATRVPQQMWGVVDLYGMTVKVRFVFFPTLCHIIIIIPNPFNGMRAKMICDPS